MLRFGILSTAKIGTVKVIPAMQRGELTEVVAIASRDEARARAAAEKLGIPRAHGSYEALLGDAEVDAIYNPLPNHLHVPWSIRTLNAGKHVLCEKPIATSTGEARQLLAAARAHPELKVMEAFMYRFHPQWKRAQEIVAAGGIGTLRTIQSFFSYYNVDPLNIRNQADIGGGGLMDIGCYCISLARLMFAAEPVRVCGLVEYDPKLKTDRLASGLLDFGRGTATFTCSTQLVPYQRVNIFGTEGRIEIEIPFNAPPDKPCKMWHETRRGLTPFAQSAEQKGSDPLPDSGPQLKEIVCPICDQYTLQGDAFARAVLENTPVPTPLEDAVANMQVIEALVASGKRGEWVRVSEPSA
jgi:predicted dehydrogenase